MLFVAQRNFCQRGEPRFPHGLVQQFVGFLPEFLGRKVIRPCEIDGINVPGFDELSDFHSVQTREGKTGEILIGEEDEFSRPPFVAPDDVLHAHGLVAVRTPFFVLDRCFAAAVQLAKMNVSVFHGRKKLDGDIDQPERNAPFPHGAHK